MKNALATLGIVLAVMTSSAAANPAADALSTCLSDNTTGKDRKDIARWVFIAMSAHPAIHDLSLVTNEKRDKSNMMVGALFTRLLSENCPVQVKAAIASDGENGAALRIAFDSLGKLAMQELMSNQNVITSFSDATKYIDNDKINSALSDK